MDGDLVLFVLGSGLSTITGFWNSYRVAQYLENATPESCLKDLNDALSVKSDKFEHLEDIFNMFSVTDLTRLRYWNQASFAKYLQVKHPDNRALKSCAPLLWRCFLYHAYLPFSQQLSSTKAANEIDRHGIDFKAFQRATTLLVLKGVDLLGISRHGDWILPRSQYSRYTNTQPRLAKLMFNSLSVPTEHVQLREESSPNASPDLYARPEQEIFDTLISIQPCHLVHSPSDAQTRIHANRLLGLDSDPPTMSVPCRILQRSDLQAVIQLLLLVRVTEQRWIRDTYPPCEDVYYAHLVSDSTEVARAAKLAAVLMEYLPRNEDDGVDWPFFQDMCKSSFPSLVLSFSRLWTAIFAPQTPSEPHEQPGTNSPNSIVQFLSLIEIAEFKDSSVSGPRDNELLLQLDLQAALLVADLNTETELDGQKLLEKVGQEDRFHFLLLSGQEEVRNSGDDAGNVLLAAFVSQPDKQMRCNGTRRIVEYSWHISILQLEPELKISRARGMVFGSTNETVTFLAFDSKSNNIAGLRLDLEKRSAVMVGTFEGHDVPSALGESTDTVAHLLADAKATKERKGEDVTSDEKIWLLHMQLQGLQCYRMPGKATQT